MPTNERLIDAAEPIAQAIKSAADIRRSHLVDKAIDPQGRPVIEGWDFIPVRSPDGSTWRIRVSDGGVITASKVTP